MRKLLPLLFLPLMSLTADSGFSIETAIKSLLQQFEGTEKSADEFTVTSHTIKVADTEINYKAVVGTLDQYTNDGVIAGKIFFTAYLKETEEKNRPVTFIFNGGPGGASLAMHIGGLGPRRVKLPEEGQKMIPPYELIDNQETILNHSDLVMIDPIGTGYSDATTNEYKRAFFGVEGDIFSFTEFIRMFCIYFERWNSPKYLMGASYGTARSCGIAESLAHSGIHLNGIVLLSSALDYSTLISQRDSSLADCLRIPTFAATSWFHKRTMQDRTLAEVVEYARKFCYEEYIPFLMQPTRLSPFEQYAFYQRLSNLIGLPASTISRCMGRISEETYTTEFLAPKRKLIGGVDSRYIGNVSGTHVSSHEDPSYHDIRPAFYPSYLNYLHEELNHESKFPKYIGFNPEALMNWNWWTYDAHMSLPNFMQRLRSTLVHNPAMKVFVGSGYYDIRTPFGTVEYSLDHLELPDSYRKNFQIAYYEAGHGFIFDLRSLRKLKKDLDIFYAN
jgi:carboxypeptidase C (cathepsin A)